MCGGTCGKSSKILAGVGIGLGVVGAIMYGVTHLTANAAVKIGFVMEGTAGGTLAVGEGDGLLGYTVAMKTSEFGSCATIASSITITDPSGTPVSGSFSCNSMASGEVEPEYLTSNDPPLSTLGYLFLPDGTTTTNADGTSTTNKLAGNYAIVSSSELWLVDAGKELAEVVGGFFAAMGMGLIAFILLIAGAILCCISCCCMEKKEG